MHNEILRRLEPPQDDKRGNGGHGMSQRCIHFDTSSVFAVLRPRSHRTIRGSCPLTGEGMRRYSFFRYSIGVFRYCNKREADRLPYGGYWQFERSIGGLRVV